MARSESDIEIENEYQQRVKRFEKEVLSILIKNPHTLNSYFGSPEIMSHTNLRLCSCNKHYSQSEYYYKKVSSLLHFTTRESALSILKSNSLRLYNLHGVNDPNEYAHAGRILELSENRIEKIKSDLFIACFSETSKHDDLTMWRLYGDNTQGICLKFDFDNDLENWSHYHLAKIQYGQNEKIAKYKTEKKTFESENDFTVEIDLDRFLAFHKNTHFSVENEVRLLFLNEKDPLFETESCEIKDFKEKRKFIEIPLLNRLELNSKYEKHLHKSRPKLRVTEVIFGPNCSSEDLREEIVKIDPSIKVSKSELEGFYEI